ncbi:ribonuclease T2 family protein [Aurantiacibacter luteus]|uniref:ribonuclease T2 family protein n=1 Tax=Aurantiacibacter luteus TaxID=1581420 RepID=UPI001F4CF9EA|nr:ribonuclease T [Aurantiacibacter luteus]
MVRVSRHLIAGLLALALWPQQAMAQAYQCRIPQGPITLPIAQRDGPVRQTRVTGYTLALTWSPEFCRFRQDSARHARMCSGREGRFAFTVHGLWPEGAGGQWPQWCPARRQPSPQAAAGAMCMMPDAALIAHEWARHGSCMTSDPDTYLRVTGILWRSLRWPDFDRLSRHRGLTAGDVRQVFADANPHWEAEDVGLVLSNHGWLTEMRLCYGADFMPTACDARRFGPPDDTRVSIWRGL